MNTELIAAQSNDLERPKSGITTVKAAGFRGDTDY